MAAAARGRQVEDTMQETTGKTRLPAWLPWGIAGAAVVALVVVVATGRRDEAAGVEALEARIASLESAPAGAGARRAMPTDPRLSRARAAAAGGGVGGMLAESTAQTPEEVAAERAERVRTLEAAFARDPVDPAGAAPVESTLVDTISSEAMAGTGLKPSNVDINCRKSSCRIVSSFASMGDAQDWGLFYITSAGGNVIGQSQMVFVPTPDGRTEVRIYASRAKG
jgi:hypothetical protein